LAGPAGRRRVAVAGSARSSRSCTTPETCECFYGPPLPLSSGAVPVCVVNRYTSPVTGTANIADASPHAGEAQATIRLESSLAQAAAGDADPRRCRDLSRGRRVSTVRFARAGPRK